MILKPVTSEKAVKMIDIENVLLFKTERKARKHEIKKEVEAIQESMEPLKMHKDRVSFLSKYILGTIILGILGGLTKLLFL